MGSGCGVEAALPKAGKEMYFVWSSSSSSLEAVDEVEEKKIDDRVLIAHKCAKVQTGELNQHKICNFRDRLLLLAPDFGFIFLRTKMNDTIDIPNTAADLGATQDTFTSLASKVRAWLGRSSKRERKENTSRSVPPTPLPQCDAHESEVALEMLKQKVDSHTFSNAQLNQRTESLLSSLKAAETDAEAASSSFRMERGKFEELERAGLAERKVSVSLTWGFPFVSHPPLACRDFKGS
jgi:hypothetical protein